MKSTFQFSIPHPAFHMVSSRARPRMLRPRRFASQSEAQGAKQSVRGYLLV
jgi:hypothetical protein